MRIIPIAVFTIACLAVLGCNQHTTVKNNTVAAVVDSVAAGTANITVPVPGMPGYVYYESGKIYPVGQQSFVDTFSIDGQQFKLTYTYNDSALDNNTKLEQHVNDKWQPLLMFDYGWHSGYSRNKDVNGDGYPDFVDEWHYGSNAHFYLPAKKTFDTAVSFELFDWELIDTAHNIYCQNKNIKGHQDESILYTFKGVDPVILYTVDFDKDEPVMNAILKAVNLYKNIPGFKDSSVLISTTPLDTEVTDFDYDTYWRKNYKELLGLK